MKRRSFLLGSTGIAGLSGCLGIQSGNESGNIRPEGNPTDAPNEFVCESSEFNRHLKPYDSDNLRWGDTDEESLRVDGLSFNYGETAEISLHANERGTSDSFNFEIYTENGWRDVRGVVDDSKIGYTDELVNGGFTWELELTEEGIISASNDTIPLEVCPDLVSGRYRFIFWGLIGDGSVAVSFDIDV
ncbi:MULTISPECIES: hypothetical protein [Halorubrum]|uniref:Uncharacterized protein n=1 Tax=Halorubrum laminariae TaxID=1433523 RepID=A0ABD6C4W4_9EURY|nr:hypothetical protein [Halorubrum laminariae]